MSVSRPRVLVVRSGETPFVAPAEARVEVLERVSHDVQSVAPETQSLHDPFDLVLFTSKTAVERALQGPASAAFRPLVERARLGAVGEATAGALRAAGRIAEIVAGGSAGALLATLPQRLDGVRVLLPCGEDASAALRGGLAARGASVTRCVVYRKIARPPDASLQSELLASAFGAFCTTSPAAARWLFRSAGPAGTCTLRALPAAVLGGTTAAFLRGRGVERVEVAPRPRFSDALALLETLARPPARK
jgi:uroporphyrinogen-III synthase